MEPAARHIAVVGGGTAGWLAALVLRRNFPDSTKSPLRISVVGSPNIPTVGVGEGSTSVFRHVLMDLGIDEEEFLRETGATIKFGIKHDGWRADKGTYYGPIDDPSALVPPPDGSHRPWLQTAQLASGKPVADIHLFTWLMQRKKSPFFRNAGGSMHPVSPFHHAYHFDQARLGRFLATKAKGIDHILAEVQGIDRNGENGQITHLLLQDAEALPVDLVIDCTGFRRAIIGQLGARWHSYSDFLPLNKAMPFWLDHSANDEIAPYTLAKAMDAGWMWQIPTQDRIGCGYVFSDAHISPDEATRELQSIISNKVESRGLITIDPGRLESTWIKNCIAVGLAQSFLEPLEATSIHGTLVQLLILCRLDLSKLVGNSATEKIRENYSHTVASQVDDFAQFIHLHYAGGRQDTAFWKSVAPKGPTDQGRKKLAIWQSEPIDRTHFSAFPADLPHVQEQLYLPVMDGLSLLPRAASKKALAGDAGIRSAARKTISELVPEFRKASTKAIGHREYLEAIAAT